MNNRNEQSWMGKEVSLMQVALWANVLAGIIYLLFF